MVRVWINGTFDILHRGHIELLKYASKKGTVRVGIDTDQRVKNFKGNDRPFNTWEDRVFFMDSIKGVDSVVGFSTDEELENEIKKWNPKYIIVGSDYKNKKVIGSQFCQEILFFDKLDNYSTTKILNNDKF